MRSSLASLCLLATAALATPAEQDAEAAFSVFLSALGMGVGSRSTSTAFYARHFGVKKSLSMPVINTGQGGWTEDIDMFPAAAKSSALVIMEWTDRRNFKNLPVRLQFAVKDPKAMRAQILSGGGRATNLTGDDPGVMYALDPDGYTIELVQGEGIPQLKSIGVGVSNLDASAAWWGGATGLKPGAKRTGKLYDAIGFRGEKGTTLDLLSWHEQPKRPTSNMPIKLVFAATDTKQFQRSIQAQKPKGKQAGSLSMFQFEPLERTLIEINSASMTKTGSRMAADQNGR